MRIKKGTIVSAKMKDTVTVVEHRAVFHPIYKKRFRRSSKFMADSKGIEDLQTGDTVLIAECKPLSKNKRFKITEVLERVPRVSDVKEEEGVEEAVHGPARTSDIGNRTSEEDSDSVSESPSSESDTLSPKSDSLSPNPAS